MGLVPPNRRKTSTRSNRSVDMIVPFWPDDVHTSTQSWCSFRMVDGAETLFQGGRRSCVAACGSPLVPGSPSPHGGAPVASMPQANPISHQNASEIVPLMRAPYGMNSLLIGYSKAMPAGRLSTPHHPDYGTSATHQQANGGTCHDQHEPCCEHHRQDRLC
jgi:hypothetical protein